MAVEAARGCGFRKIGGIYICADSPSEPCERLPLPLLHCPTCKQGVKHSRGFSWITREYLFAHANPCDPIRAIEHQHDACPVCKPSLLAHDQPGDKSGLIWIGVQHYSPGQWLDEALELGVSRRVPAIPRGMVIGKTRVFAAHKHGLNLQKKLMEGAPEIEKGDLTKPAVIHSFIASSVEVIVTDSLLRREQAGEEKWLTKLIKQGATPVAVPEDDADHAPKKSKQSPRKAAMDRYAKDETVEPAAAEPAPATAPDEAPISEEPPL